MRAFVPLGLALIALFPPAARSQSLILYPTADTFADQSQPAANFGTSNELGFGKNFTYTPTFTVWFMRAYLQFDLLSIQLTGRWPTRVVYRWYQNRASAAGCLDVSVHRVTAPWAETGLTWQNKPANDPAVIATACVGDSSGTGWKEADVTLLVHAWLMGTSPNFGFVVKDPSESNAGAARPGFAHSRETGLALTPHLDVQFASRFGYGCSLRALLPITDVIAGQPKLGRYFVLGTTGLISGSAVGVVFGLSNTTWSGGALPWSMAPIGFPHCDLLVAPDVAASFGTVAGNGFDVSVPLPLANTLNGTPLYMQVLAAPPIPGLGLELSQGIGVVMRS
ncbi:MAG: DNRLRE domain-containing protein [Planctomycetes bacterium]|nr:DNRLRE domain-containing protein [Planctomycetota bacterium]